MKTYIIHFNNADDVFCSSYVEAESEQQAEEKFKALVQDIEILYVEPKPFKDSVITVRGEPKLTPKNIDLCKKLSEKIMASNIPTANQAREIANTSSIKAAIINAAKNYQHEVIIANITNDEYLELTELGYKVVSNFDVWSGRINYKVSWY